MFIVINHDEPIADEVLVEKLESGKVVQFGAVIRHPDVDTDDAVLEHADDNTLVVEFPTHVELYRVA